MAITLRVPGTSANLGAGFDAFGIALSLYNTVEARWKKDTGFIIENCNQNSPELSDPKRNWVTVAAKTLLERAGEGKRGIHFRLDNRVPVSRGLGSSAAAIVGGLFATNALLDQPFTTQQVLEMAVDLEGHPDNVAPAVYGGFVASTRREDGVTKTLHVAPPASLKWVVAVPEFQLSTHKARGVMPKLVPMADAVYNIQSASMFLGALQAGDFPLMGEMMQDKLHQPYRFPLIPGSKAVLAAAKEAGAYGAAISGAGPTLIAVTETAGPAIAKAMVNAWQKAGINAAAMVLDGASQGVEILR